MSRVHLEAEIPAAAAGQRLDRVLARLFPDYSRSRLQHWIRAGAVRLDGMLPAVRTPVQGGERVVVDATLPRDIGEVQPEAIALELRYVDADLFVVDKPAGMVVHPAAGNPDHTLQNALLHLDPALAAVPRAGIVHRLDKDTSGLLVVARNLAAHAALVRQLQERTMGRTYLALVRGRLVAGGTVAEPIGRHPRDRKRMAVVREGRHAVTHYRVLERFPAHSLLQVRLETGRTHQIRVHMAHLRHPIVGDPVYGGRLQLPAGGSAGLRVALRDFRRQALHAARLTLCHPRSGERLEVEAPVPADMADLLQRLREDAGA